ncbi:MAG: glycosyltransferase family 2 protein [Planktomarina sp.]
MPRFSIIIPFYNAAKTLPQTLCSLRSQTFEDWEAICVDDESTDDSTTLVDLMTTKDARIQRVRNVGKGPSAARNMGAMDLAKGDIVVFMDADDLWTKDKLAELNTVFENTSVDGAFARVEFFDQEPGDVKVTSTVPRSSLSVSMLLGENPVCTMSNVAVRKSVFAQSRGFDQTIVHNEDLEWLIRLVAEGANVVPINSIQVFYRNSPTGLSSDLRAMMKGRQSALSTAQKYGFTASPRDEAIHLRYLARRSLRLQEGRMVPLRLTWQGLRLSPRGFLSGGKRGILTAAAAFANLILPNPLRSFFFA